LSLTELLVRVILRQDSSGSRMRSTTNGNDHARVVDAIVIGAGQAGLAASGELLVRGVDHVVFERGRVGETWRSQRWDSFVLNTPEWMNCMPGASPTTANPTRFPTRSEFVESLERYVAAQALPVRENVEVLSAEANGRTYLVETSAGCYRSTSL